MSKRDIKVITSGYFDPLHIGHIEYLEKAKELGTQLTVIINNDKQAILKKGKSFMNQEDRKRIVESLKCVDKVVISIDEDETVIKTIEKEGGDIFAKGGDRHKDEIPEREICDKLRISIIDGLGNKIESSSNLLKNYGNT